LEKDRQVEELQKQLADLTDKLAACKAQKKCFNRTAVSEKFTKTDALVKLNTGLNNRKVLDSLC
jgi:hypothetical protein